jgi:NAD+ kinase
MKKFALFVGTDKAEAISWAEFTAEKLKNLGASCFSTPELLSAFNPELQDYIKPLHINEYGREADIVISFGGDGTMLSAARTLLHTSVPIMGVNVGRLGFLAEFSVQNLEKSISDLLEGNYRIVDRVVIETKLDGEIIHALNDFVIEKKDSSRMITVQAYANEHFIADYRADGVILTTPTGSTAYSLSCGGPILAPSAQVFCLNPISPHSLNHRPIVLDDSTEIMLKVNAPSGVANFVADGQIERILKNNESLIFTKSESKAKLIKPLGSSYYDLLRAKLLWATNPADTKIIKS